MVWCAVRNDGTVSPIFDFDIIVVTKNLCCFNGSTIMTEIFKTKSTYLGKGLYGCRVINVLTNKPIVELRVKKSQIGDAFYDMLRMLDKCGHDSPMAKAARHRGKGKPVLGGSKTIWHCDAKLGDTLP